MQLIILTCQDDPHADAVIRLLQERRPGARVVRVNSDNQASILQYCFEWSNNGSPDKRSMRLLDSGAEFSPGDIPTVMWYRKPGIPPPHPSLTDGDARQCSSQEQREWLRSFDGFCPGAVWANDPWRMQRYSVKVNQIPIAREVGLTIPETLITNDLEAVKRLARRHREIIIKPLAYNGFVVGEEQYGCYTNVLTVADLEQLQPEDLAFAPAIFQQRIEKVEELRVTVIGESVFACAIGTTAGTVENIDWRIRDVHQLPHRMVELPAEVGNRLKRMLELMGLNFGAFDLIRDGSGNYYFIEVNPNGQYFWIELLTGAALSDAMVGLILWLGDGASTTHLAASS